MQKQRTTSSRPLEVHRGFFLRQKNYYSPLIAAYNKSNRPFSSLIPRLGHTRAPYLIRQRRLGTWLNVNRIYGVFEGFPVTVENSDILQCESNAEEYYRDRYWASANPDFDRFKESSRTVWLLRLFSARSKATLVRWKWCIE